MHQEPIIEIRNLRHRFGKEWVLNGIDLTVHRGEIIALMGGSGSGKTTILRSILMLLAPTEGAISIFGIDLKRAETDTLRMLRRRFGVMFQRNALWSGMTVLENVMFPLRELTTLPRDLIEEVALLKIALVGLSHEAIHKYPAQLSGGMQKRVAAARALALDPELLFLDEPTAGLDPQSARQFDALLLELHALLGLTIVLVSHDLNSITRVAARAAFLGEGRLLAYETVDALKKNPDPMISEYFNG